MRCAATLLLGLVLFAPARAQQDGADRLWRDSLAAYWSRIDVAYGDSAHSPLKPEDRAVFTVLDRFAPDPAFRVQARFKPARNAVPFTMRTTTQRQPVYVAYGTLTFKLKGKKCRLTVYRDAVSRPGQEDHLFLPFTDLSNGAETYGGGRYIDMQAPLGDLVELDFNRAYNPYCAYNGRYSCPIPPAENHLPVVVHAGVRKFHD